VTGGLFPQINERSFPLPATSVCGFARYTVKSSESEYEFSAKLANEK
jgi:hypothetical protein